MREDEFSDLVKKSLGDDLLFQQLTAAAHDEDEVYEWLCNAVARVDRDLTGRRAKWVAFASEHSSKSREYRDEIARYNRWRSAAVHFKSRAISRRRELDGRRKRRNESIQHDEKNRMREHLIRVGKVIEAHQAERASDADLYALLDEITVPHGLGETITLREILNLLLIGELK